VIDAVTTAVVDYLAKSTQDLGDWIEVSAIDSEAGVPTKDKLHVVLYGIDEHGYLRNLPLEQSDAGLVRPPLFLRLSYLLAYFGDNHDEVQRRLGRVVEVFHTTPILHAPDLSPALAERVQSLTVRLRSPSLDERNQLWTALSRAMRLALYYEVDVAPVPVTERDGHGHIETLDVRYEMS
jgi:Pvc16 N-terminal domain